MNKEVKQIKQSDISLLRENTIKFLESEGYKIEDTQIYDFGYTVKLVISREGQKFILPVSECFYDTDEQGNMSKFHGILKIDQSPWYQSKVKMG